LAIIAAAIGFFANATVAYINGVYTRALEAMKAEENLVLEAVKTHDPDKAAANLAFLVDTHLFEDDEGYLKAYLKNRKPGTGVAISPAAFTSLSGTPVLEDANAITLIAGPYPHDVGPHTYVHGVERGVLVVEEAPETIIDRLKLSPVFAKLTRPGSQPVWINGAAVKLVRSPLSTETADGKVNAVIEVGDLNQGVSEDVATAKTIINAHGGHLPP
jgi:hypothetical protein